MHSGRRIKWQFQGSGARRRILGRSNGLARGTYSRSVADDCFPGEKIPAGAKWCSAYQLVLGSDPAYLSGLGGKDEDPPLAQGAPPPGQFTQLWGLRMMAQQAASKGAVDAELRRLLARNKPFKCTDMRIGDAAPVYETVTGKARHVGEARRRFWPLTTVV